MKNHRIPLILKSTPSVDDHPSLNATDIICRARIKGVRRRIYRNRIHTQDLRRLLNKSPSLIADTQICYPDNDPGALHAPPPESISRSLYLGVITPNVIVLVSHIGYIPLPTGEPGSNCIRHRPLSESSQNTGYPAIGPKETEPPPKIKREDIVPQIPGHCLVLNDRSSCNLDRRRSKFVGGRIKDQRRRVPSKVDGIVPGIPGNRSGEVLAGAQHVNLVRTTRSTDL